MINTETKDFRLVVTKFQRYRKNKSIETRYIPPGNFIVTDGWGSYSWLNNFGYIQLEHNYGEDDLGFANESTSYAENTWNILKKDMISTCFTIQNKNFMLFLRKAEYKFQNRKLSYDDLIKDFFEAFNLISSIGINYLEDPIFLNNKDFNINSAEIMILILILILINFIYKN